MRPKLKRGLFTLGLIFTVLGLWVLLNFDGDLDFGGHYLVGDAIPSLECGLHGLEAL
jgi:hypothetical protein